ncbi:MAG: hypothetical protein QOD03_127, partial [Verrucomicrobiota bacterium]
MLRRRAVLAASVLVGRALRAQFFLRQFAVAVFVELLQRGGGIRDFVGVNRAVVIRI